MVKAPFGPGGGPTAIAIGPDVTVTIPAVGLILEEQPYTTVMPDVSPGIYRVQDTVWVGSSEDQVFSLVQIESG